jgi:predicted HAD superfamily Cof-like phosphohydrolase
MMGLPWDELWDDVHRANMAKERGVGKRGHAVDCVKPVGWTPPKTEKILQQAGYCLEKFFDSNYNILEERCIDDVCHK